MNTTVLRVTDEHIAGGTPGQCSKCPVALALLEVLAAEGVKAARVEVDVEDILAVLADGSMFRADLDSTAFDFVAAFDFGNDAKPFETTLEWREVIA